MKIHFNIQPLILKAPTKEKVINAFIAHYDGNVLQLNDDLGHWFVRGSTGNILAVHFEKQRKKTYQFRDSEEGGYEGSLVLSDARWKASVYEIPSNLPVRVMQGERNFSIYCTN